MYDQRILVNFCCACYREVIILHGNAKARGSHGTLELNECESCVDPGHYLPYRASAYRLMKYRKGYSRAGGVVVSCSLQDIQSPLGTSKSSRIRGLAPQTRTIVHCFGTPGEPFTISDLLL